MKKTLILIAIAMTVLAATAAAADFHAGGYDGNCVLCQVNHLPLTNVITTPFIPEKCLITWWTVTVFSGVQLDKSFTLHTGRSPPESY
ncbi:MAG: hypothetical protein KAH12_08800 [Anaerolineales bacterium]|nr:hypothetical protein [Anaerolineales bacterium]